MWSGCYSLHAYATRLLYYVSMNTVTETSPAELDFYLSERAFDAARAAGVVALQQDPEELQALLDYVADESGKTLDTPLASTTFVLMRGDADPRRSDPHYFQAPLAYPLVHASHLAQPGRTESDAGFKQDLVEAGASVLEVRPSPRRFYGSIGPDIARVVLGPRPEDAQIIAPLRAWYDQARDALFLPDGKKQRIQEEVARRFPSAVVLRRQFEPRH